MNFLNRQGLVIKPRKPFIDWVQQVDIDLGRPAVDEESIRSDANVYLIPALDSNEENEAYLRGRASELFENELAEWYTEPSLWPRDRGWEEFQRWFEWEFFGMVYDLEAGELVREQ